MEKNFLLELTKKLYRLTLLFPKKEPLRYKMREMGDVILEKLQRIQKFNNPSPKKGKEELLNSVLEDLEILNYFFEIANEQNWIRSNEIYEIQKAYENLTEETKRLELKKEMESMENFDQKKENFSETALVNTLIDFKQESKSLIPSFSYPHKVLSERQKKILTLLKEKGKIQVWQVKQVLPDVTKRTLRRDFENLLKKGIIERIGERNNTFYQIKTA